MTMMNTVVVNAKRQLVDQQKPIPTPTAHDVLVKIKAISVNPIDIKRIQRITTKAPKILGYDALGEVVQVGAQATKYQSGDVIFYAGSTSRDGSYADYQLVDERITALAPRQLTPAEAVAMPLTWLTAYEILIDQLGFQFQQNGNIGQRILVINGAGGAGSILTQLAHYLGVEVFATSSPQHFDWLRQHGTAHPLDYHQDLQAQIKRAESAEVDAVINLFDTNRYLEDAIQITRPFGKIVNVAQTAIPIDMNRLQAKALSFTWELMFTKANYGYRLASQGQALAALARLLDEGMIHSTLAKRLTGPLNAKQILQAHAMLETNQMVGKIVIEKEATV